MVGKRMAPDKVAYGSLMEGHMKEGNLQEAIALKNKICMVTPFYMGLLRS
ncbi:hypothetical protein COCNU_08G007590 [Cocos nucifera]|uniref:Uncharacterized protein n=1 Tax=Cocos nucifera TaxID=13894 RepID=A0A8K0IHU3_COCNU|nr:hypothetical protein COCNU_08G007590 [Cocos nucifera]